MSIEAFIFTLGYNTLITLGGGMLLIFIVGYLAVLVAEYYNRRVFPDLVALYSLEKIRAFHANRRYLKVVWDSKKHEADMLNNPDPKED